MRALKVKGGTPLCGTISPSGCKNAVLPILAATTLASGVYTLDNVPKIKDVEAMVAILEELGVKVTEIAPHKIQIDTTRMENKPIVSAEARKMRSSYYFMSTLLTRFGEAKVAFPGGCDFSKRPIDQHLKAFRAFGADVEEHDEPIGVVEEGEEPELQRIVSMETSPEDGSNGFLKAPEHEGTLVLDIVSVGTTINAMMAAVLANGTTIIKNAAREPHVVDCANFLNSMGAQVKGAGTENIRITGVRQLHATDYTVIPDQIEAATFMIAAAATQGNVKVENVVVRHLDCITDKLREMGVTVELGEDWVRVRSNGRLRPTRIKTAPYPGFPTDMLPMSLVLMCLADGTSLASEGVYETRFSYTHELELMGAHIEKKGPTVEIKGMETIHGTKVSGSDLRATAALVVAAIAAKGPSIVTGLMFLERGYEDMVAKLKSLGANIRVVDEDPENWLW